MAGGTYTSGAGDAGHLELDAVEFCRIVSRRTDGDGLLTQGTVRPPDTG